MSLNWKEIDLILSELSLDKGKIQQVRQKDFNTLYLGIYASQRLQHLYFYLNQNAVRMHLAYQSTKKKGKTLRFQQLLQSRLVGSSIESIEHLYQDRMILFRCKKRMLHKEFAYLYLFVRLWNNQSNIILYDSSNTIIDAMYRRPLQEIMPKLPMPEICAPKQEGYKHKNTKIRDWDADIESSHPFNDYIAQYYNTIQKQKNIEKKETQLLNILQKAMPYLEKTIKTTKEQIEKNSEFELSLFIGNQILANIHTMQSQQEWLSIQHPQTNNIFTVHLDSRLSPVQNAEHYFQQYKKAQRMLESLRCKLEELETNYLNISEARILLLEIQQEKEIEHNAHNQEIKEKHKEHLEKIIKNSIFANRLNSNYFKNEASQVQTAKITKTNQGIGLHLKTDKYVFFIGRNAKENDSLLRHVAHGNDTWMHVRNSRGAFVFIRSANKQGFPLDRLEFAAQLACLFSKCKHASRVELHYTQVKYLRRIPKKIGMVSIQRDKNLSILFNRTSARAFLNEGN